MCVCVGGGGLKYSDINIYIYVGLAHVYFFLGGGGRYHFMELFRCNFKVLLW